LVLLEDTPEAMKVVDCGFAINTEYSPANFYELAKMDGALVLSSDGKRILHANAQLIPDSTLSTSETGTRHRTAERVAKQTGALVVAISQRRNIITMYLGGLRYTLKDITFLLSRSNQALHTLERYKTALRRGLVNLNVMEFEDLVGLSDVAEVLIRAEKVSRISREIEQNIIELGSEGRLVSMQMEEVWNLIQDYCVSSDIKHQRIVREQLAALSEDSLERYNISRLLGFSVTPNTMDVPVVPRGYRVMRQIPRLPGLVIDNLVSRFKTLNKIQNASLSELDDVEGIGEARAKAIKDGMRQLREKTLFDGQV